MNTNDIGKAPTVPKIRVSKTFSNIADLSKIEAEIQDKFGQYLGELAGWYMQKYINEMVYNRDVLQHNLNETQSDGSEGYEKYHRSGALSRAVIVRRYSNGEWRVGIDGRKLPVSYATEPNQWGQHAGFDGVPFASEIAASVNYGQNSPLFAYQGINFVEETQRYIDSVIHYEWDKFKKMNKI